MRREEVMRLGCFFPRIAWANESRLDEAVAENDRKVRRGQANQMWEQRATRMHAKGESDALVMEKERR